MKREKQLEINDATNIRDKYKDENDDDNHKIWQNKVSSLFQKEKTILLLLIPVKQNVDNSSSMLRSLTLSHLLLLHLSYTLIMTLY